MEYRTQKLYNVQCLDCPFTAETTGSSDAELEAKMHIGEQREDGGNYPNILHTVRIDKFLGWY
jgi:hypothetical protein